MPFSSIVKEEALLACGRCCCICHAFCGIKIEVHHIVPESKGGANSFDNAIPLCFNCHSDMLSYDPSHPKGNTYSTFELKRHRDNWYARIEGNIGLARCEEVIETDKTIFKSITKLLPWKGSIGYLSRETFEGAIQTYLLQDLYNFDEFCSNPILEFLDPDLESLRVSMVKHVRNFIDLVETKMQPVNSRLIQLKRDRVNTDQTQYMNHVNLLQEGALIIVEIYNTFMRTGIRKFGVLPQEITEPLSDKKEITPTHSDKCG